ncbi:hypothetical protein BGZ83_009822 [Gryganskiella cystojenkinii]|nr:hypothetical protein BGZ83_009822 [Gryganskiella cystojenkinii]
MMLQSPPLPDDADEPRPKATTTSPIPPKPTKQKHKPKSKTKTTTPAAHKKPKPKPKSKTEPMETLIPVTKEPEPLKPNPKPHSTKHHTTTAAAATTVAPHPTENPVPGSSESGGYTTPAESPTADLGTGVSPTPNPTTPTEAGGVQTSNAGSPSSASPLPAGTGTNDPNPSPGTPGAASKPTPTPGPMTTHGGLPVHSQPTTLHATTAVPTPRTVPTTTTTTNAVQTTVVPTTTTTTEPVSPSPSSSGHHRTKTTTTPWLPTTIEPIAPPKHTHTVPPGASLPDVVIPDLNPDIPPNSIKVHLRLKRVSYYQVITNGILAAQLVSFIPGQLCQILNVDCSLIMVLAIRDGVNASSNSSRKLKKRRNSDLEIVAEGQDNLNEKKRTVHLLRRDVEESYLHQELAKRGLVTTNNAADAILVTVAIPQTHYWDLSTLVADPKSSLYVAGDTLFGQFFDSSFPLSNNPPPSPGTGGDGSGDDGNTTADPLTGGDPNTITPNPGGSASGNNGPVIGSLVGLAAAAYVGIAMLVVRRYRNKKLKEQEEVEMKSKISAPINVQESSQGWGWHSS